jgi:hypothetical protein
MSGEGRNRGGWSKAGIFMRFGKLLKVEISPTKSRETRSPQGRQARKVLILN